MDKRMMKVISLVLSVAMVLSMIPGTALAAQNNQSRQQISYEDDKTPVVTDEPATDSPTPDPTATPEPTVAPKPTVTPEPTATPKPTATAETTATPQPSQAISTDTNIEIDSKNSGKANKYIDIPSYVSKDSKDYYQHIKKLDEYDSENTIAFQNKNGTKTLYYFTEPIRYKDANGNLVDYDSSIVPADDNSLKKEGYSYKNKSSDVEVYLPDTLVNGTGPKVDYKDYSVEILPKVSVSNKSDSKFDSKSIQSFDLQKSGKKVMTTALEYNSGYNDNTQLVYIPQDTGIKEELVINKYTGQNTFDFILNVKNLIPELRDDGYIILKDKVTKERLYVNGWGNLIDKSRLQGSNHVNVIGTLLRLK